MTGREWAVVTGASGGLGEAFCERLARDGLHVVLAARSTGPMEQTAERLRTRYGVEALVVGCDLGTGEGRRTLLDATADLEVGVLVNNAGFGIVGDFAGTDPGRLEQMVTLNCVAVAALARAYAPAMVARRRGAIVNVASTAAFQPLPGMAAYAASKSFVLSLSQAMWDELRPHGVAVLGLCPGATATGFFEVAGDDAVLSRRRTPDQVVDTCFVALRQGRPSVVDGALNKGLAASARLAPVRVALAAAKRVLRT